MTHRFDPPVYADDFRRNPPAPLGGTALAAFGAHGAWQAGAAQLRKVVLGWWACEAPLFETVLAQARDLLAAPASKGKPWGEPAALYEATHRHARALAHWMTDENRPQLWREAADAHVRALEQAAEISFDKLVPAAALCRAMAGMEPQPRASEALGEFALAILDVLQHAGDPVAFGSALHARRHALFADQPGLDLTTLFALAHAAGVPAKSPDKAILPAYVLDPDFALPPSLVERGWSDRREALLGAAKIRLATLEPLLGVVGLSRDPDTVPQGDPPEFASWTRHPDLSLEVDWHARGGEPDLIEIRGSAAGRLASLIAETVGGKVASDPEEALSELLTVQPRSAPASPVAAAKRWEILCATVSNDHAADEMGGRALIAAGLADSDWRSRMTALWAIGHFHLPGLAREAEAAALPESGFPGLSQDDRRVLLAMRDLAAARSAGRGDTVKRGANAGFVADVAALLDRRPTQPEDRMALLLAKLLRLPLPATADIPTAWKQWLQ